MRPMTAILFASMSCALSACAPTNTAGDDPTPAPADAAAAPAPAETTTPSPPAASEDLRPLPEGGQAGAAPGAIEDSCNAEAAKSFVGKTADAAVAEQARTAAGAQVVRALKPGQMVTMEFRAGRLNLDVDENNVITNVRCG